MRVRMFYGILMVLALVVSACDGGGGAEEAATATPIAEVATATPVVAEEATPTTEAETTITDTEGMTGTEGITGTEGMTGTDGTGIITGTEEMTGTEGMTGTDGTDIITGTEEMTDTGGLAETDEMTGTEATAAVQGVVRASELLSYDVQNFEGEGLGSINDAMVSLPDGCIDYMLLSFGGILGLGDNLYLLPWRAITIDPVNERLVLNVQPEALNDAPLFDVDNLPDFTSPDWDTEVRSFWENMDLLTPDANATEVMTDTGDMAGMGSPCAGALSGFAAESTEPAASESMTGTTEIDVETPRVLRLSDFMSFDVANSEGEDLGALEDIMIDWRQDRVVYAILSFGGFLGLGEKWFPIPLNQVSLDPIDQRIVFDVQPEMLENAPGFDEIDLPDTTDPNWDAEIRNFWEQIQ